MSQDVNWRGIARSAPEEATTETLSEGGPRKRRSWTERRRSQSGQASLISLLAAVVIVVLLAWVFLFRHKGEKTELQKEASGAIVQTDKKTIPGAAMDQAKGVECANNLRQLRQAVQMDADPVDGTRPASLQALPGIPAEMKVCPASGRPYVYDPKTGQIHCLTPGHQNL
jgi:hypothetical protein